MKIQKIMRRLIFAGIVFGIVVVALVLSILSDDDIFLNNKILPDKTFQVETIGEKNYAIATDSINLDERVIFYSVESIPDVSNKQIIQNAVNDAFTSWEEENNNLIFEKTNTLSDIQIEWQKVASYSHAGLATYSEKYQGVITIGLGKFDCKNNFVQYDNNLLHQTIMHEIGHILGLGHHPEETHLMYGLEGIDLKSIDNFEYTIPEYSDGFFEGYIQLENNYNILNSKLEDVSKEIEELEKQEYVMIVEYEKTILELENDIQYIDQVNLMEKELARLNYQINSIYDEYNTIVYDMNEIVDAMSCFPDVTD